jgi:hypothetical protein
MTLKILRLRLSFASEIRELRAQHFDIVAKTWAFGPNPPADRDFYYGDLQSRLARRKVRTLMLYGDANDTDWQNFARSYTSVGQNCRLSELCLAPIHAPVAISLSQLVTSLRLRLAPSRSADPQFRRVETQAALDCLMPRVTQESLLYDIAKTSMHYWKPRALVTLYEGHAWEKCVWWAAKTENPHCRTVGYQHTVLFPEALSVLNPVIDIPERSVPDVVLALGERTRDLLEKGHTGVKVIRFGSFRHQEAPSARTCDPSRRTILVLPEGIATETETLFRFAYECARLLPGYKFVLRAHPQWPSAKALLRIDVPVVEQQNIEISTRASIDEDFQRASVFLYRGSSSSLYGILKGLLAVFVRQPNMLDSDPVYEMRTWRKICSTPSQLVTVLQEYESQSDAERQLEWLPAREYVNGYIVPVDETSIDSLLGAIDLDRARTA